MGREYGSVKALSADGTWNKWAVDTDWRQRGAKSSTAMSDPQGKSVGRAAVKPLRCAVPASHKPRVTIPGYPSNACVLPMAAAGEPSWFARPARWTFLTTVIRQSAFSSHVVAVFIAPWWQRTGMHDRKTRTQKRQINQRTCLCRESSLREKRDADDISTQSLGRRKQGIGPNALYIRSRNGRNRKMPSLGRKPKPARRYRAQRRGLQGRMTGGVVLERDCHRDAATEGERHCRERPDMDGRAGSLAEQGLRSNARALRP
jgi:hypothetical protein